MTSEETWERLVKRGVAKGKIPKERWNLRGGDLAGADLRKADLRKVDLSGADLFSAVLREANLYGADLSKADLTKADLSGANLAGATLYEANLVKADLHKADLRKADLLGANLRKANFSEANLTGANLSYAVLIGNNFEKANLNDCKIYGISAWDLHLKDAEQSGLIITPESEPTITIDNLRIAQFLYMLLNNSEIRDVLDSITLKVVLILGRFSSERLSILEALRKELGLRNYIPVLFDFERPQSRDITETVRTLAHMARFVIADISEAKSIPQELMAIVPNLPSVPVQPLLQISEKKYGMFDHFERFPWVLPIFYYKDINEVIASLSEKIIFPAEAKAEKQKIKEGGDN